MKEIVKIEIKGSSGYVPVEYVFKDKVILTPDSISYEYVPYLEDSDKARKWKHQTDNPEFREQFEYICNMIPAELNRVPDYGITDIGTTEFVLTYSDKTKENFEFTVFPDFFEDLFREIVVLVPGIEPIPEVLRTAEDEEDEEEIDYPNSKFTKEQFLTYFHNKPYKLVYERKESSFILKHFDKANRPKARGFRLTIDLSGKTIYSKLPSQGSQSKTSIKVDEEKAELLIENMLRCVSKEGSHQEVIYDDVARNFKLYFRDGTEMKFCFSYSIGEMDTEKLIDEFIKKELGIVSDYYDE